MNYQDFINQRLNTQLIKPTVCNRLVWWVQYNVCCTCTVHTVHTVHNCTQYILSMLFALYMHELYLLLHTHVHMYRLYILYDTVQLCTVLYMLYIHTGQSESHTCCTCHILCILYIRYILYIRCILNNMYKQHCTYNTMHRAR